MLYKMVIVVGLFADCTQVDQKVFQSEHFYTQRECEVESQEIGMDLGKRVQREIEGSNINLVRVDPHCMPVESA